MLIVANKQKPLHVFLVETNKVKKERYLMRQDNTVYNVSIKLFFKYRTRQIETTETNTSHVKSNGFNVHILSTRLSWAHNPVISWTVCLGQ